MTVPEPLHPDLVESLRQRSSYPGDPSRLDSVQHIQTHLSHVFLTEDRVYKLRKAVAFDFVDFGTRAARRRDCEEEVRLNRRLAPDVYLGVANITSSPGGFLVGAPGEPGVCDGSDGESESVTVMRHLPDGCDALTLVQDDALTDTRVDDVARMIAGFHRENRLSASEVDSRHATSAAIRDTLESLDGVASDDDAELLERIDWRLRQFELLHGHRLALRVREGRQVDGHGDLHLQHIWFEDEDPPRVIDCLEFGQELRQIDAAADIGFLTMDLRYRGRGDLAERFLATYAEETDDYGLFGVLPYFESYRAAVRAKVAGIATHDPSIGPAQREAAVESRSRHLDLATRILSATRQGGLVLTSGSVGTGKSTVARHLAEWLPGLRISSDVLRKQLAGLPAGASAGAAWGQGAYTSEDRAKIYTEMLARASEVVRSGRTAILDATYATRDERDAVREWADRENTRPWLIHTECHQDIASHRLRIRRQKGDDASDAGPEHLEMSRASYETPIEWPVDRQMTVDMGAQEWRSRLRELSKRLAADRFG